MKFTQLSTFFLIFTCLFTACKGGKSIVQDTANTEESETPGLTDKVYSFSSDSSELVLIDEVEQEKAFVVASIERTACYGKCPVYQAKIFSNGLVLFDGKKNTSKDGLFEAYIVQNQIDSLIARADSIQFFAFAPSYPVDGLKIYDLPSTQIFIKKEETEKTVINNHNAPKLLRAYENYFEQFLNQLDWKQVEEKTVSE